MSFSSEAISLIEYMASKFGIMIDWSNQNVLPVIQTLAEKYITWEISTSIVWIVLIIIFEIALAALIRNDYKSWHTGAITIVGCIIAILLIPAAICQIFDIIRCITFPEFQIFQYLQSVIETMK